MPRINSGLEVYKQLDSVTKYILQTTSPGDQTTTGATTVGGTTVLVGATTNFTTADMAFLTGSAGTELVTLGTVATTMPIGQSLLVHPIGSRLVEVQAIALGHIDDQGVDFGGSLTLNPINAATSRVPIAYFADPGEFNFSFNLLGENNLNMQAAFGVTEGETGAGTSGSPYGAAITGAVVGNQSALMGFRFLGQNNNSQTIQLDLMGCSIEVNVAAKMGGGTPIVWTLAGKYTTLLQRIWT